MFRVLTGFGGIWLVHAAARAEPLPVSLVACVAKSNRAVAANLHRSFVGSRSLRVRLRWLRMTVQNLGQINAQGEL